MAYARRMYRFEKIRSMFERSYGDMIGYTDPDTMQLVNDRLTPFQRQFVKLVQGITWEHVLRQMHTELTDELFEAQVHLEAGNNISAKVARRRMMLVPDLRRKMARRDYIAEQHVAMLEALRGTKAGMDKLVKQTVIAMEDDVYAQYYNPALERMQRAAQEWDVELSQIERATILTNNRALGKVAPQATYEFNLPKRGIAVAEALKAAYALHQDLGPLLGDPNFATLGKLYTGRSVSGAVTNGSIKKLLPGLPSDTDQKSLLYADNAAPGGFASNLQQLVPDPEIYKIETGTGFEVRPVVQPDGQSVTFDFNYMYSTDLLEPVNADEKHLGRIKRHFVNTEVQLGNLEWREISRYEVALRASRKGRGVPLLEDVPLIGLAFKPLPQSGGSIQKNIIVGQAAVYPTIDELMGLRPAAAAEDIRLLTNEDLRDIKAYQLLKARSSLEFQQQKLQEFSEKVNKVEQLRQQRRDADAARGSTLPLPVPQRSTSHRPAAPVRRATVSGGSPSGSAIRQAGFRKPAGSPKSVATSRRVED